jgi:type I restriction enzyme S subunit
MSEGNGLPEGWVWAAAGDACVVLLGSSPDGSTYNTDGKGLPFFQGKAEFGEIYPTPVRFCHSPSVIAIRDDVLVSVRAPVGPTNLCPFDACIGRGLAALRPVGGMAAKFLLYAMRDTQHRLASVATGTTFSAVSGKQVREHLLPVAPVPEQHRIVEKIEALFGSLDEAVSALTRARANLKRYRASVLKSAVEGRLTKEWRKANPQAESGTALLERILRERRENWEREQLASFRAKGKEPPKGWRERYEEPEPPDTRELPELPEGWAWAKVEQVVRFARYGTSARTETDIEGTPVLRMGNLDWGSLRLDNLKYLPADHSEFPDLLLEDGDLLFNRTNSPELVGKSAVYRGVPHPCSYASYLIALRFSAGCLPDWLSFFLNSHHGRIWVKSVVIQQVGQANVNGSKLQAMVFPLPPLAEQRAIVALVEERLSQIDDAEKVIGEQLARAGRLRQSILKRAFEGRLVPQDPNDEPASVLLERIKASADAEPKAKGKRKTPKAKATTR